MNKAFCRSFYFIFSIIIVALGCKDETIVISNLSSAYFPTDKGNWIDYQVDSIYHSENDHENDDSVYRYHFQIREIIDSSYADAAGRVNQIIKRYHRLDSSSTWSLTNVWTQSLSDHAAYRTEDNICFHKLSFPMNTDVSWNGNDVNTMDEEMYVYDYIHQPWNTDSFHFDSTTSVVQINENNFVETLFGNEIYASGIGLVYKERDELGKINGIVVKGLEYRMKVIGYGKN
jgi:hypothetical protein